MIPKIVHHVWTSGDKYQYEIFRQSWRTHNPDYQLMFWTPENFEYDRYSDLANRILKSDSFWQLKCDVVTWEILRLYGGIRSDNDMFCLKNFDPLLKYDSFAGRNWGPFEGPGHMGDQLVGMSVNNLLASQISEAVATAILTNWQGANSGKIYKYTDEPAYPFLAKCDLVLPKEAFNPFGWQSLTTGKNWEPLPNAEAVILELLEKNNWYPESYAIHFWGAVIVGGWSHIMKTKKVERQPRFEYIFGKSKTQF